MRLIDANTFKAMKTLELCSKMKAHGTPSNSLVYMQSPSSGSGNKNEASVIKRAKALQFFACLCLTKVKLLQIKILFTKQFIFHQLCAVRAHHRPSKYFYNGPFRSFMRHTRTAFLIPESRSDYNYKRSMITFTKMWQGFTLPKKKTYIYSIIKSSIQ